MGQRRTKGTVKIAALIANGQLEHCALVVGQYALHLLDIGIQLGPRLLVPVIVNPGETQEERYRRAQLGQEFPLATA